MLYYRAECYSNWQLNCHTGPNYPHIPLQFICDCLNKQMLFWWCTDEQTYQTMAKKKRKEKRNRRWEYTIRSVHSWECIILCSVQVVSIHTAESLALNEWRSHLEKYIGDNRQTKIHNSVQCSFTGFDPGFVDVKCQGNDTSKSCPKAPLHLHPPTPLHRIALILLMLPSQPSIVAHRDIQNASVSIHLHPVLLH